MKNARKVGVMRIGMIADKMQFCVDSRASSKDFGKYVKLFDLLKEQKKEAHVAFMDYFESGGDASSII